MPKNGGNGKPLSVDVERIIVRPVEGLGGIRPDGDIAGFEVVEELGAFRVKRDTKRAAKRAAKRRKEKLEMQGVEAEVVEKRGGIGPRGRRGGNGGNGLGPRFL